MKLDFTPSEWQELYQKCDFTDEEKQIIELKRRHGNCWVNHRYAKEINLTLRTFERRLQIITQKIIKHI